MGSEDIIGGILSIGMVMLTISIQYETKRLIWNTLPTLKRRPRLMMNALVVMLFAGHTVCIWTYGIMYWLLAQHVGFGALGGMHEPELMSYIYFSAATYSSLGFGDIYPVGPFRMLAGVEAINGLLLIGWSVALTYAAMERFWGMHRRL